MLSSLEPKAKKGLGLDAPKSSKISSLNVLREVCALSELGSVFHVRGGGNERSLKAGGVVRRKC